MLLDAADAAPDAFYAALLQVIVPRPIAWVLSRNADDTFNVAPFSFFNGVAAEPPLLMIAVGRRDDGSLKDTSRNIEERDEFVVHIPPTAMAEAVSATSAALPPHASEIDFAGLRTVPVEGERLPRINGPAAALFCRRHRIIEVGTERASLIIGEVRKIWIDEAVLTKDGARIIVDPAAVDPLARLGGRLYAGLGAVRSIERPKL